jgi:ribonucleoside-diphosphate reductase beta chain
MSATDAVAATATATATAAAAMEPLLNPEEKRFTLFPIRHPDLWKFFVTSEDALWRASEIDMSADPQDWDHKLNDDERHFLKHVLAFFAASDGIVNENLAQRFSREVQYLEASFVYGIQSHIENVHSQTYSLLIDTYIRDPAERDRLFNAIDNVPCVQRKAAWALKWIDSTDSFATRLVAFALVEGVFFSASFCAIFWIKQRGILPGLCSANTFIARDEGLHQTFAAHLYKHHVVHKLTDVQVHEMVASAVAEEAYFCTEALPVKLLGMNADDMIQYIRFVADRLLQQLGHPKLYHATNPFTFMELLSITTKSSFMEVRSGEYSRPNGGFKFDTEADF